MDTPQVFDYDPRVGATPQQKRKTLIHTDPPARDLSQPRLTMAEALRRAEQANGTGDLDPEVFKAKAIVQAAGALTDAQKIKIRRDMMEQKRHANNERIKRAILQGQFRQEGQQQARTKAAAERAIMAAGGEPTAELLELFGVDTQPTPPIESLRVPERPGQAIQRRLQEELAREKAAEGQASVKAEMDYNEAVRLLQSLGAKIEMPSNEASFDLTSDELERVGAALDDIPQEKLADPDDAHVATPFKGTKTPKASKKT